MYVLVDMEWISNQRGNHWPTQLAAARVDVQWNTVKCKKPYTGLDRRILTCYNNILYSGIAKLVSRLVWERVAPPSSRKMPCPQSLDTPAIQALPPQVEVVKKTA